MKRWDSPARKQPRLQQVEGDHGFAEVSKVPSINPEPVPPKAGGQKPFAPLSSICSSAIGRGANARARSPRWLARMRGRALIWLLASTVAALSTADAFSAPRHKAVPLHQNKAVKAKYHKHTTNQLVTGNSAEAPLPPVFAATKQAIELMRQRKTKEATALATSIGDPVAQQLVEWALLRHSDSEAGFERYAAFIRANPDWPSIPLLRRRAEGKLWQEGRDAATVRRFVGEQPTSAAGRLAFARVLMSEGDRAGADREVRAVWQSAQLPANLEAAILGAFPDVLTRADHAARMDRHIGVKDFGVAMRAARRLGKDEVAIVAACSAVEANSTKGGTLLDAVPSAARGDLGYALCRLHWLLRHDGVTAAVKLVLEASREDLQRQDTDEWWRKRRVLARKLIDLGDAETAYRVVHEAAPPANPYYRSEFHFMAGWIALRFLADPTTALKHFAHVDEGATDPIILARAAYWRGRAAEATGQLEEMYAQYEAAARHATAYYGQLARARLGLGDIMLLPPLEPVDGDKSELLHAANILYAIGDRGLFVSYVTDLAKESSDAATLAALGQLTAHYNDARAMLLIGKTALARGFAMDQYAFPDIGVPPYSPIGPPLDRCVVNSIVRIESAFNHRDMSRAKAVGLMQVTPVAGRDTAKRFGVAYNWSRLVSDPVYNTQIGAAEVAALLKEYRGSYIMTFAGYNAGRGRVEQWVAQHGDPRDPKVDPIDWIERIPFAETRNYVQRVMESLQVYRARFGASTATVDPNLYRAATGETRAEPASVEVSIPQ